MNSRRKIFTLTAILVLALCGAMAMPAVAQAKQNSTANGGELIRSQGMEGSWTAWVTIRDCTSGAPLFTFPAMQTYAQGGTMQDSSADSRRSAGHGVWRHVVDSTYKASFQFFNFDNLGAPQGTTRVSLTNTVDRRGDSFTTVANVTVYNMEGNVVVQACATSTANRFAPEID